VNPSAADLQKIGLSAIHHLGASSKKKRHLVKDLTMENLSLALFLDGLSSF